MKSPLFFYIFFSFLNITYSQSVDTVQIHIPLKNKPRLIENKIFKASAAPVILIGLGVATIKGNGFPSSYLIHQEVQDHLNFRKVGLDNYLLMVPYISLVSMKLLKVESSNDLLNSGILLGKSLLLNSIFVISLKNVVPIQRPDSLQPIEKNSFPSGHTAYAFAAATLMHKEFGKNNIWYSLSSYSVASAVGVFRILNNRHWFSDVLAGAGFGILSVNLAYLTHQYRWGSLPGIVILPQFNYKSFGLYCTIKL